MDVNERGGERVKGGEKRDSTLEPKPTTGKAWHGTACNPPVK